MSFQGNVGGGGEKPVEKEVYKGKIKLGKTKGTACAGDDARLPDEQQKAALKGSCGAPDGRNVYVTSQDPRMKDARPPQPHGKSHESGPDAIGESTPRPGAIVRADAEGTVDRWVTEAKPKPHEHKDLNVTGLRGKLADPQEALPHEHGPVDVSGYPGELRDPQKPLPHTHKDMSVDGLRGLLADPQKPLPHDHKDMSVSGLRGILATPQPPAPHGHPELGDELPRPGGVPRVDKNGKLNPAILYPVQDVDAFHTDGVEEIAKLREDKEPSKDDFILVERAKDGTKRAVRIEDLPKNNDALLRLINNWAKLWGLLGKPLLEAYSEVITSTTATEYVDLDCMAITPAAGTYEVHADCEIRGETGAMFGLFRDNELVKNSERSSERSSHTMGQIQVNGLEAIKVRWKSVAGKASKCGVRHMVLRRIS